jgi:PAS domain S-box-containing protein
LQGGLVSDGPRWADGTFRGLLESALDALVIVDAGGLIVFVNAQAERLFGYRREELWGELVEMLVPDRDRGRHADHRTRFAETCGVGYHGERSDQLS